MIKNNADLKVAKISTNETILHCFLQQDQNNNPESLNALLNHENEDVQSQIKSIINKKDINGNTALHIGELY